MEAVIVAAARGLVSVVLADPVSVDGTVAASRRAQGVFLSCGRRESRFGDEWAPAWTPSTAGIADNSLRQAGPCGREGKWCCLVVTRGGSRPHLALGKKEEKDVSLPIKLLAVIDVFARAPRRPEWLQRRWVLFCSCGEVKERGDPGDLGICFANRVRLIRVSQFIYLDQEQASDPSFFTHLLG